MTDGDTNGDGTVDWKDLVAAGVPKQPPARSPLDDILGSLVPKPPAAPPPPPPPAAPPAGKTPPAGNNGGSGTGSGSGSGKGGAGTAANTDQTAGAAVDASAANSQNGFQNSQANMDQLRSEIQRLGPILNTPEGQQQLMDALQRYLQAGGGQLQATDGAAQQQAGGLQGLLDQLQPDGKKSSSKDSSDNKDDSKDSSDSKDSKSDSSDLKDLLSSLAPALQSLTGQQNPLSQLGQQSPFGQQGGQSPFGQNSPFGPNSTPAGSGVTPATNPFGSVPGATPAGGGSPAGGGTPGTPGSPFDALKTDAEKQADAANGAGGDGKDDPNSKTVTMPDGSKIEAPTVEAAQALRASATSDDATAAYQAAHVDIKTNPGTLVDPSEVQPGDYARWDDGQMSMAAGPGKVVNNGQVVDVNTVATNDQGFEGWYRPEDGGGGQPAPTPKTTQTASGDK